MQEPHDILGIERLISKTKAEIESYQPTPDEFQRWNDHPITQRLKKQIAIELHERKTFSILPPNQELYDMAHVVISYGVNEVRNDE